MERLDARIKSHDKDIERMCNFHYQGFIDSIRELLQVRSQAKKLNVSISVKCVVLISKCRLCFSITVCLTISPITVTCCAVNFVVCLSVFLPICFKKKHEQGEEYVLLYQELQNATQSHSTQHATHTPFHDMLPHSHIINNDVISPNVLI